MINIKNLIRSRIFQVGIIVSLFYWLVDAFAEYYFLSERTLMQEIFSPKIHNFSSRIVAVIILFVLGVLAEIMTKRRRQIAETLRESEARFKALFEKSADAQLFIDEEGKIIDANAAFLKLFEFTVRSEAIGIHPMDFAPEYQPDGFTSAEKEARVLRTVLQQGSACLEWEHRKHERDRITIYTEWTCTLIQIAGRPTIHVIIRDVSEPKWTEKKLHIQHSLAFALGASTDLEKALRLCLDAVLEISGMDCGGIYLVNQDSGSLELTIYKGFITKEFSRSTSKFSSQDHATLLAMRGEPVYARHDQIISGDEIFAYQEEGLRGIAVIPIKKEGKVIASLNLASHILTEFPPEGRRIIETIAAQIGDVIARLQIEEALHRSEEKYRSLVESSTDGIAIVQGGKVVFFNSACIKMFALEKPESVIGRDMAGFFAPVSRDIALKRFSDRAQGLPVPNQYEVRFRREDGTEYDAEATVSAINYKGQFASQVMIRDIAERAEAAKALKESEEKYRNLVENIPDSVALMDLEGKVWLCNRATEELIGYTMSEAIGMNIMDVTPLEYQPKAAEALTTILRDGSIPYFESVIRRKDGALIPVETGGQAIYQDGKIIGIQNITRNIAARKRAEQKLYVQHSLAFASGVSTQLEEALQLCMDAAIKIAGMDCGIIYLVNQDLGSLELAIHQGFITPEFVPAVSKYDSQTPQTVLVMRGKPVYSQYPDLGFSIDDIGRAEGLKAVVVFPIQKERKVIAGLMVASHTLAEFPPEDRGMFESVAAQIGDVIARLQAEKELRRSEEKYRSLVESSTDGIAIVQEGKVVFFNTAAMKMYALEKPEDALGRPMVDFISTDFRTLIMERMKARTEGLPVPSQYEVQCLRRDGTVFDAEAMVSVITYKGQFALQVIARDITERKKIEEDLRKSEEKYRMTINSMDDLIFIFDGGNRFSQVFCSKAERLLVPSEFFIGKKIEEVLPEEVTNSYYQAAPLVRKTKKNEKFEYALVLNNQQQWFSASLDLHQDGVSIVAVIRDITGRKRIEQTLKESEDKYRAMFELSRDAIMITDRKGFLDCNPATLRMFGCSSRDQFISKHPSELSPPLQPDGRDSRIASQERIEKALVTGALFFEWLHQRMDGTIFPAEVSLSRIEIGGKQVIQALVRDISERRQVEEALRRSEEMYRTLVETSPDVIVVLDLEGRIRFASSRIYEVFGFENEEDFMGKKVQNLNVEPDEGKRVLKSLNKATREGLIRGQEYTISRKDGRKITVESRTSLLRDASGQPQALVVIARDVTERKQMDQQLIRIQKAVEGSGDAIGISDAQGRHFYQNKVFTDLFGYSVSEIGDPLGAVAVFTKPEIGRHVFETIMRGDSWKGEIEMTAKDGRVIPVIGRADAIKDSEGQVLSLIGIFTDITERKRAEATLRDSEERYRLAFENVNDVIYSIDRDMKVRSITPSIERILGYKPEEILGKPFMELTLIAPESAAEALEDVQGTFAGEKIGETLYEFIGKNGERHIGEVSASPVFQGGKVAYVIAIARDVTERIRIEKELVKSETKYKSLVEEAGTGIAAVDLEGRFTFVNNTLCDLTGFSQAELLGRRFFDFIHPDDRGEIARYFMEQRMTPTNNLHLEYRVFHKNGELLYLYSKPVAVQEEGKIVGAMTIAQDITKRKIMEEALKKAADEWQVTFNSMNDAMVLTDSNCRIMRANRAFSEIVGLPISDLVGRMYYQAIHQTGLPPDYCPQPKSLIDKKDHVEKIYVKSLKKHLVISTTSILTDSGDLSGMVFIIRDVTEENKLQEKVRQVEKLAAIGEIAGGIAHEIKNPLFAITSGIQLLRETKKLEKKDEETLDVVFDSMMRVNRLINQLLVFGSVNKRNFTQFSIPTLIRGIIALNQGLIRSRQIKINIGIPKDLPEVNADSDQLNQVFTNIIQNAIEVSNPGDTVEVRSKYEAKTKRVRIEFADRGPGIPAELRDKIFLPFYTNKKEHSGLGLPISRKIVLDHGGEIWVTGRKGGGSSFIIELPI